MPNTLDPFTKPLVKAILTNANSYSWSIQGLGMLRLYLAKDRRLHVWTDLRVENVSDTHTHPWHFDSQIVAGVMRNQRFIEDGPLERIPTHEHELHESALMPGMLVCACGVATRMDRSQLVEYNKVNIVCGENACVVGEPQLVKLWPQPIETYVEGQRYRQQAHEIHRTTPEPGTVTLCSRKFLLDTEHANVYWQGNGPWVDAKPRPATPEEVEKITGFALERWF